MIGNDVIDLNFSRIQSNWKRKGLIQKLFTAEEQLYILESSDPEIAVWLLWSMKEAAYKIYHRKTQNRLFIPQELTCIPRWQSAVMAQGQVFTNGLVYHTKTTLCNECIHTIATALPNDITRVVEIERNNLIKDKYGIPHLLDKATFDLKPVSISHHGRFEKVVTIQT